MREGTAEVVGVAVMAGVGVGIMAGVAVATEADGVGPTAPQETSRSRRMVKSARRNCFIAICVLTLEFSLIFHK